MPENSKKIVIIEDDAVLRRGLKRFFQTQNFLVIDHSRGKKGLDTIFASVPDIVLCDYKLPDINGLEILKIIRGKFADLPFVLMTGYYKEEILSKAKNDGANRVLEKPLVLQELKEQCLNIINIGERNGKKQNNTTRK